MKNRPLPISHIYLSHSISEPAFDRSGEILFYVKVADGHRSIIRQSLLTGLSRTVTTEPTPKGGVGYGGGIFAVREDTLVYAADDGRLYGIDLAGGRQWSITPRYEGVAAPAISPSGRFIAFLCEQDGRCNVLVAETAGRSLPVKLSEDPWYAFNPVFSPDGGRIVWQEWDEDHMPWDEARLKIGRFARPEADCERAHEMLPLRIATLARQRVSYGSPQFSPDGGRLAYTSDESGWRSLWTADADGRNARIIETGEGEIGGPDWVPGLVAMRWTDDGGSIYTVRRRQSRDKLLRIDWPEKKVTEYETGWSEIGGLQVRNHTAVFVGSNPTTPPMLLTFDPEEGATEARASCEVGLVDPAAMVTPEVLSWKTHGDSPAWGVFYRAAASEQQMNVQLHPLIIYIHGGPTSERAAAWDAQAQYFATRGWHYLVVNYRGGTGFGREYQDMLRQQWGIVDVEDAYTGALHLIDAGLADPRRVVITGGSAGGYTTLMALTRNPDFWAAGVSLYGIGNLYDLKQGAHRFEVAYEDTLIGKLPEEGPRWKERSPLTYVKNVRAPVLLFHGTEDRAVPHGQSVEFAEAVRCQGGVAELVSYEGEGHGFQKEKNRRDVIERMERFLDKYVLCKQG